MKTVFLVCYGGGHANLMAPVHQRLLEEGQVKPVTLALSVAKQTFLSRSLPYKTVSDYEDVLDADTRRYGEQLADRWHVEGSGLSRADSVAYLGASMRDLVLEVGEVEAWCRIERSGRQAFLPLYTMDRILAAEQPDLIVTTNSPRMERAATLVGNRLGIPTLNIHDDLGFSARDYRLTGDCIAVMSEITRENLVAQGHRRDAIVITGHPAFDAIPEEQRRFDRQEIISRLGLPGKGPYVLLGTSQPGRRGEVMASCSLVAEAVGAVGRGHLIIKPHPGEDAQAYHAYARQHHGRVTVVSGVSIREVLTVSEFLITFASTIALEALLMAKPIISLNPTDRPDPLPFVRWGLGLEARTQAELQDAMLTIVQDPRFRRTFDQARERWIAPLVDGRATNRVVHLIYRLAGVEAHAAV